MYEVYGSRFIAALHGMVGFYKSWQGTFLFNFLVYFCVPYGRGGLPLLHVFMIAVAGLFIFSLWFFLRQIINNRNIRLFLWLVLMIVMFCLSGTENNVELFLWYTGACNYTIELALSFIAAGLLAKAFTGEKIKILYIVVASVLGFLACGGSLNITAFNCALLLIETLIFLQQDKKRKLVVIPFLSAFAGAIVNVVAPGNYVRFADEQVEGHETILDAVRDAFICYRSECRSIFSSLLFIGILVAVFCVIYLWGGELFKIKINIFGVLTALLVSVITQYLVIFPVTYGYHSASLGSMRTTGSCTFIIEIMFIFVAVILSLYIRNIGFLGSKVWMRFVPVAVAALVFIVAFTVNSDRFKDINNGYAFDVVRDIKSGALLDNYNMRAYVLGAMETAPKDTHLVLWYVPLYETESAYGMGLSIDPDSLVNRSAANYFRLPGVTMIFAEEE